MLVPNRHESTDNYRYGFQGQEKDDEIKGEGNSYHAEFWQYDSRIGRRWNPDPIVKTHESPYAAFANNPIWFTDRNGADTTKVAHIKPLLERMGHLSNEMDKVGKQIQESLKILKDVENIVDEHSAWSIALGTISGGLGSIMMEGDYLLGGTADKVDKMYADFEQLQGQFEALFNEYDQIKGYLKIKLGSSEAIQLESTGIEKNSSGVGTGVMAIAMATINKNSNTSKSNFAIYEFDIDGEKFKFGVADATRVTKSDIDVKRPNGSVETIKSGTPVRIYAQYRAALSMSNDVKVSYTTHENTTKLHIKQIEDRTVWKWFQKNGYVPDGNSAHAKKWKKPQQSFFKFKKLK